MVECDDVEGWAVVTNDDVRLGLFESKYMDGLPSTVNFGGGDVFAITDELQQQDMSFAKGPTRVESGGCGATIFDPYGHKVFFDSTLNEVKQT